MNAKDIGLISTLSLERARLENVGNYSCPLGSTSCNNSVQFTECCLKSTVLMNTAAMFNKSLATNS